MDPSTVEKFFGPYLSERQWGTVREDYSHNGDCWRYLSHDKSRYTVYLHGEDGLFGWSDHKAKLCSSLALWNGRDRILKERLFGLTGLQGNHGEDVKEIYYYLDNVSDHSYMRALYRYPQSAFPYKKLIRKNREQKTTEPEFELIDTGVFDHDYWDIYMEFAKEDPKTCLCRYTIHNRGKNPATLHILPQIWLRDTWSHNSCECCFTMTKPNIEICGDKNQVRIDYSEGSFFAKFDNSPTGHAPDLIFTENEAMVNADQSDEQDYKKDAFHQFVIAGETTCVNPKQTGTKCAAVYCVTVNPGSSKQIQMCLWPVKTNPKCCNFGTQFDNILKSKAAQVKKYYAKLMDSHWSEEEKNVAQQAYSGLLWSKQFYCYDVQKWFKSTCTIDWDSGSELSDDEAEDIEQKELDPLGKVSIQTETCSVENSPCKDSDGNLEGENVGNSTNSLGHLLEAAEKEFGRKSSQGRQVYRPETKRNKDWLFHLRNCDVISMPDKWEFPWYATWDLAFHMIPFCTLDPTFSKKQLLLFLSDNYLHPTGQLPAYEFDFSDTNPPVHAWACLHVYRNSPKKDIHFLKKCFHKLLFNYTWWINAKKIPGPGHLYAGGFLGLDNISVYNRSFGIPPGYMLAQADGTGWMAFYSLKLFEMALELSQLDIDYLDLAERFLNYFFLVAESTNSPINQAGFWDEEDNFFYDILLPQNTDEIIPLCIRSWVGLVPLLACSLISVPKTVCTNPKFLNLLQRAMTKNKLSHQTTVRTVNEFMAFQKYYVIFNQEQLFLSVVSKNQLQNILACVLNEAEFLSPFGIRSLSKHYKDHPYPPPVETDTGHRVGSGKTETCSCKIEDHKSNMNLGASSQHDCRIERNPGERPVLEDDDDSDIEGSDSRYDDSSKEVTVKYSPGESICGMFGGNSNWRGPIWLCMNYLFLESLENYYGAYGDNFQVELPTGSGKFVTLQQVVREISQRIVSIFIPDKDGKRPVHGGIRQYAEEENWRHLVLFYEFFHAESGRGCGASHQTGWTALVVEFLKKKYS